MARQFNGTSDVLATSGSPSALNIALNAPLSFCGWVNFHTTLTPAVQGTLFGKGYGSSVTAWTFYLTTESNLSFGSFDGSFTHGCFIAMATLGWQLDTWHHVYGDYTGTTWRIWADGIHQTGYDSVDASGPISNTAKFEAGAVDSAGSPGQFGDLSLADVAVFDAPLTDEEILALGTGALRPNASMSQTLLGYWPINGGSPELDGSGNGNDLIVTGTTTTDDPPYGGTGTLVLSDRVLDLGLDVLDQESDAIYVCSDEPTTYTEASDTFALGNKAVTRGTLFNSSAAGTPTGRKISSNSLTSGTITTPGTPTWWAVVDSTTSRLLARGPFSSTEALTTGTFNLGVITIGEGGATS